jgi:hypothetical protein
MKSNKLILFAVVTIAVVVAATMMSQSRAPTTSVEKTTLFPTLLENVNNVSSIGLIKQDQALTLSQVESMWGIEQADNYPANFGKIRETVIAVANLAILAEKTTNADLYKKLGVEDPAGDSATSLQLSLFDKEGNSLASLIVGNARRSKSSQDKDGLYVRLPNTKTALLVEGNLDISADVKDWFKRELFSINASRVKNINISQVDASSAELSRNDNVDDFVVSNVPVDMEMQSNIIISRMGTILEDIFVDNVIAAEKLTNTEQITANIHTFDGLMATIITANIDGVDYSSFSFSIDEHADNQPKEANEDSEQSRTNKSDPAEEAQRLNAELSGWAYAIPSFKSELFTRKSEDLVKKAGSAAETSADSKTKK